MGLLPAAFDSLHRRRHVKTPSRNDALSIRTNDEYMNSIWYKIDLKRNTRSRRIAALTASFAYLISWVFLILVELGSTQSTNVLGDIYFFRLSLADIIPQSVENAQLINSIARGLGLHDFYQAGLWNYCEGYNDEGITYCSTPQQYYWFNPVQIILNELLSGATIALPSAIIQILSILQVTSHIMFACFLAGSIMSFAMVFMSPIAIFSRWWSIPMAFFSGITFVLILAATVIASVISFVFKYAATAQSSLNIHAYVGTHMFIFMWAATGCALIGFILHAGMGCCCTSRRDLKKGRKPMRHQSIKRAQSQRSQTTEKTEKSGHAREISQATQPGQQGRSRSNTAFSFEQPTDGPSRSGTLMSMNDEAGVGRSNTIRSNKSQASRSNSVRDNSAQVSRSNTLRDDSGQASRSDSLRDKSGQVSRSNDLNNGSVNRSNSSKINPNLQQQGRNRSGTLRSIRFEDDRPPSYESEMTAVNESQEVLPTQHRHKPST